MQQSSYTNIMVRWLTAAILCSVLLATLISTSSESPGQSSTIAFAQTSSVSMGICGDAVCDPTIGENCSVCDIDCGCDLTKEYCNLQQGSCNDLCGDGFCDPGNGEDCTLCEADCACSGGQICGSDAEGSANICVDICGDGTCDVLGANESCLSCAADCGSCDVFCTDDSDCGAGGVCSCEPGGQWCACVVPDDFIDAPPCEVTDVDLGDLNGDGYLDAFVSCYAEPNQVYINNGVTLVFDHEETESAAGIPTQSSALGDIDRDGDLDVIVGNDGELNRLYINDGNGTFTTKTNASSTPRETTTVEVGDLDGDGDLDYIEGNADGQNFVYLNQGNNTFLQSASPTDAYNTQGLVIADLDGDGDLDYATAESGSDGLIYENDGSARFTVVSTLPNTAVVSSIAAGDVDQDGDQDLYLGVLEASELMCKDGLDNDADTETDCADDDCIGQSCGDSGELCCGGGCSCPGGTMTRLQTFDAPIVEAEGVLLPVDAYAGVVTDVEKRFAMYAQDDIVKVHLDDFRTLATITDPYPVIINPPIGIPSFNPVFTTASIDTVNNLAYFALSDVEGLHIVKVDTLAMTIMDTLTITNDDLLGNNTGLINFDFMHPTTSVILNGYLYLGGSTYSPSTTSHPSIMGINLSDFTVSGITTVSLRGDTDWETVQGERPLLTAIADPTTRKLFFGGDKGILEVNVSNPPTITISNTTLRDGQITASFRDDILGDMYFTEEGITSAKLLQIGPQSSGIVRQTDLPFKRALSAQIDSTSRFAYISDTTHVIEVRLCDFNITTHEAGQIESTQWKHQILDTVSRAAYFFGAAGTDIKLGFGNHGCTQPIAYSPLRPAQSNRLTASLLSDNQAPADTSDTVDVPFFQALWNGIRSFFAGLFGGGSELSASLLQPPTNEEGGLNRLFINNGGMNFTPAPLPAIPSRTMDVAIADYNADGYQDLFSANFGQQNHGHEGVPPHLLSFLTAESGESVAIAFGDLDNSQHLDMVIGERDLVQGGGFGGIRVYTMGQLDSLPLPPTLGTATIQGSSILFDWNDGLDSETSANALEYVLRIGTQEGLGDILPASVATPHMAARTTEPDAQTRIALSLPTNQDYYWSVATRDSALQQSDWLNGEFCPNGCTEPTPTQCSDDVDNDNDGLIDCEDPACRVPGGAQAFHLISDQLNEPMAAAVGDVDGDGDMDIVATTLGTGNQKVLFYASNGASPPIFTEFEIDTSLANPLSIALGDLDGDADLDIAVAQQGGGIYWYENSGGLNPAFTRQLITGLGSTAHVHVADLNGDGRQDVISPSGSAFVWMRSDGNGSFTSSTIDPIPPQGATVHPSWAGTADLDGDGDLDVVVTSRDGGIWWFSNSGGVNPTFTELRISVGGGSSAEDIAFGDFDGDGDMDFAASREHLEVWWNDGSTSPQFSLQAAGSVEPSQHQSANVTSIDFDGDGRPDIVHHEERGLVVFSDVSWSTTWNPQLIDASYPGNTADDGEMVSADIDGNGRRDVVFVSRLHNILGWYELSSGDICDPSIDDEGGAPPVPACSDGIDNADPEDGLADADDPGCYADPRDRTTYDPSDNDETHTPICGNDFIDMWPPNPPPGYIMEDCDDGTHCADGSVCHSNQPCADGSTCQPRSGDGCDEFCQKERPAAPECSDGIDNADTEDVLIDIHDPGCHTDGNALNPLSYDPDLPSESNVAECGNGGRESNEQCDDGKHCDNGSPCIFDSQCATGVCAPRNLDGCSAVCTIEGGPCLDQTDNDGDGIADYPGDLGCLVPTAPNEWQDAECFDGIDNDGDGAIDDADFGCRYTFNGEGSPEPWCNDGIDNDGDGLIDCADPGCLRSDLTCDRQRHTETN